MSLSPRPIPGGGSGSPGVPGKSAYQSAVDNGFVGTEAQWVASLTPQLPDFQIPVVSWDGTGSQPVRPDVPGIVLWFQPTDPFAAGVALLNDRWVDSDA